LIIAVAAKKYLLPKLTSDAHAHLYGISNSLEADWYKNGDATGVLKVIELLACHKDHDSYFATHISTLTRKHVAERFKLGRLRAFLETVEGQEALECTTKAVTWGRKVPDEAHWFEDEAGKREFYHWYECDTVWSPGTG
jgi:hypothetical protein